MPSSRQQEWAGQQLTEVLDRARNARDHVLAWRRTRLGPRGTLPYLLAMPLPLAMLVSLGKGNLGAALGAAAAFALIVGGTSINRRGLLEELVGNARRFTRSAGIPHRYLAATMMAAGTGVAAYAAVGQGLLVSVVFGLLTLLGYHLAYRLPRPADAWGAQRQVVGDKSLQRALAQAEQRILAIEKAAYRIVNRELSQRLQRIAGQGRAILELIVARPEERFRARKFLNVYLEGAERVAGRYAQTHRLDAARALEQNFRTVLIDIEAVFERQLAQLAEHDVSDLDIQIEVLRKQLEREGIT